MTFEKRVTTGDVLTIVTIMLTGFGFILATNSRLVKIEFTLEQQVKLTENLAKMQYEADFRIAEARMKLGLPVK